jgi:hypothetical protein
LHLRKAVWGGRYFSEKGYNLIRATGAVWEKIYTDLGGRIGG